MKLPRSKRMSAACYMGRPVDSGAVGAAACAGSDPSGPTRGASPSGPRRTSTVRRPSRRPTEERSRGAGEAAACGGFGPRRLTPPVTVAHCALCRGLCVTACPPGGSGSGVRATGVSVGRVHSLLSRGRRDPEGPVSPRLRPKRRVCRA